jgi:lysophospholipase L1-like esterase
VLRRFVTLPLERVEPEVRYQPHPVRRFTLMPDQRANTYGAPVSIDQYGFRLNGSESRSLESRAPRVLALGDSFTFGLGVHDEETWPAQLETRLNHDLGTKVEVVNAGTISYGTFQEMNLLRTAGLQASPLVVVHGLYWNDFMNAAPPDEDAAAVLTADGYFVWDRLEGDDGSIRRRVASFVKRSALLFTLRQAVSAVRPRQRSSSYAQAYDALLDHGLMPGDWEHVEDFYRELLALGRENSFQVLVVVMPVNGVVCRPGVVDHPYPREARRRLESLGIPFIDGFKLWSEKGCGDEMFLPQGPDAHLNPLGYRLIADAVADWLLKSPSVLARMRPENGEDLLRR